MKIHPPRFSISGKWVVLITDGKGPLSPVIEKLEFPSRETAWQAYKQCVKGI